MNRQEKWHQSNSVILYSHANFDFIQKMKEMEKNVKLTLFACFKI